MIPRQAPTGPTTKWVLQRAHDQARQRGVVDAVEEMIADGAFAKFNVGPHRIRD